MGSKSSKNILFDTLFKIFAPDECRVHILGSWVPRGPRAQRIGQMDERMDEGIDG